jgi:hypothetical protein
MNYQPLPIEITQNGGHHYRQVWRDDHAAVYAQRNAFGALLGYEAIAIKRAEPCHAFGKDYSARELYPCSEDWGTLAISTSDFDRAMDAAKHFSQRVKQSRKARQNGSKVALRRQQRCGERKPCLGGSAKETDPVLPKGFRSRRSAKSKVEHNRAVTVGIKL